MLADSCELNAIELPARHFSWRHQGSALSLFCEPYRSQLRQDYDLLLTSSVCNLCQLRGLAPQLTGLTNLVYFHENQFAFPSQQDKSAQRSMQITEVYTALAADRIAFNSSYNLESFLRGAVKLLKQLPERLPSHILQGIEAKATILPVPLEEGTLGRAPPRAAAPPEADQPTRILWNHRWEADKGLEILLAIAALAKQQALPLCFVITGPRHQQSAKTFTEACQKLAAKIQFEAFSEDRHVYLRQVASCHLVLSTAKHEFQGLSIMEAARLGLTPIVPDALAYPEYIPDPWRYRIEASNIENSAKSAINKIRQFVEGKLPPWRPAQLSPYLTQNMEKKYRNWLFTRIR